MTSSGPTMAYMSSSPTVAYMSSSPTMAYMSYSPTMADMKVIGIDATVDNMTSHGCILWYKEVSVPQEQRT